MVEFRRVIAGAVLALVVWGASGCQVLHDLQPHRLKRLNHGVNGMPASDYYSFESAEDGPETAYHASVDDPVAAE